MGGEKQMNVLYRPGSDEEDAFGLGYPSEGIPHPGGVFVMPVVDLSPGWFSKMLISLNEARWEMCAMCGVSKLRVTNAATSHPPFHMFPLSPVLKTKKAAKQNCLESHCLIFHFTNSLAGPTYQVYIVSPGCTEQDHNKESRSMAGSWN